MTDTTVNAADSKRKVADHHLLKPDGTVTKEMNEATGIRYTSIEKPDAPFTFMFDGATPGTALTMLALFGAKTKATNEASRVRNGEGGGADEQLDAVEEVFEQLTKGVWREKSDGVGGARIDWRIVAEELMTLLGSTAQGTVDTYHNRITTEEAYRKKVWSNDAVKAAYRKRTGKTGPALESLA